MQGNNSEAVHSKKLFPWATPIYIRIKKSVNVVVDFVQCVWTEDTWQKNFIFHICRCSAPKRYCIPLQARYITTALMAKLFWWWVFGQNIWMQSWNILSGIQGQLCHKFGFSLKKIQFCVPNFGDLHFFRYSSAFKRRLNAANKNFSIRHNFTVTFFATINTTIYL